jgi:hypothetical protein
MNPGSKTPEELETLLEDAFVLRDCVALADLFEDRSVLLESAGTGRLAQEAIAIAAEEVWETVDRYLGGRHRIFKSRDTALLVGDGAINVARRGDDGAWRFAISLIGLASSNWLHHSNDEHPV